MLLNLYIPSNSVTYPRTFQAYDSHCNLVLSEVEESIYGSADDDQDDSAATQDPDDKPIVKRSEMLFVRGELLVQRKVSTAVLYSLVVRLRRRFCRTYFAYEFMIHSTY